MRCSRLEQLRNGDERVQDETEEMGVLLYWRETRDDFEGRDARRRYTRREEELVG